MARCEMSPRFPSGVGTTYNAGEFSVMAGRRSMSDNDSTSASSGVIGRCAEDLAAHYLEQRGLPVVARNFRCRGGEIDLVCRDGPALVFVEVRLRRNTAFGGAGASIGVRKQQRLIVAARHYLARHARADSLCRFECIVLEAVSENNLEWIRDAFAAP